eukprot:2285986-Pleurochrysis_carterae.AAC.2
MRTLSTCKSSEGVTTLPLPCQHCVMRLNTASISSCLYPTSIMDSVASSPHPYSTIRAKNPMNKRSTPCYAPRCRPTLTSKQHSRASSSN